MYKITCHRAGGIHLNLKEINGENRTIRIDEFKSIISEVPVPINSNIGCGALEPWVEYNDDDIMIKNVTKRLEEKYSEEKRTEDLNEATKRKKKYKKIK